MLNQRREKLAFEKANFTKNSLGSSAIKYKICVKKMCIDIKTNGLGIAMAFAFGKGSKKGKLQPNNA